MRVLSGIQPSGSLHLGNYFGMMKRMIAYQEEHELFCFIVNYHALTSYPKPNDLRNQTYQAALDFLALGLDPNKCTFWVQSDVPEVTELTWLLSNCTGMGLMERSHSYKDKIAQGIKPNHGLFSYPILMTADILLMQADRIPVGKDQKQHIEIAQDIAESFNHKYGETFKKPEPEIEKNMQLLPGIDGRKMSKSYDNIIKIFSDKNELKKKVMKIKTDSTPPEEAKSVEDNILFDIYSAFMDPKERLELEKRFKTPGLRYGDVKKELVELIWKTFEPFREKRMTWEKSPGKVKDLLEQGARKASKVAKETLESARTAMGLDYKTHHAKGN